MGNVNCCNGIQRLGTNEFEYQGLSDSSNKDLQGKPPTRQSVLEPIKNIIGAEYDVPLDVQDTDIQNPSQSLQLPHSQFLESNIQSTAKFLAMTSKQFEQEEQPKNVMSISDRQIKEIQTSGQEKEQLEPNILQLPDINQSLTPAFPRGSFQWEQQNKQEHQNTKPPQHQQIFIDDMKESCTYKSQNTVKSILKKTVKSKKSQMNQSTKKVRFEQNQPVLKTSKTKNFIENN